MKRDRGTVLTLARSPPAAGPHLLGLSVAWMFADPAEVFAEANRFGGRSRLWFVSVDGGDVTTSLGTRFAACTSVDAVDRADTVPVAEAAAADLPCVATLAVDKTIGL